jgi:hypothetical protein
MDETTDQPNNNSQAGPSGLDELFYSLGEALRSKQSKEAIALLIQRYAEDLPNRSKHARRVVFWGYALTVFLIIAVGTLGHCKVISSETTGALIGTIVGGIFYGSRR